MFLSTARRTSARTLRATAKRLATTDQAIAERPATGRVTAAGLVTAVPRATAALRATVVTNRSVGTPSASDRGTLKVLKTCHR